VPAYQIDIPNVITTLSGGLTMCMPSVWIVHDKEEEQIFEEIAFLRMEGSNILLSTMFGEEQSIEATIDSIDFVNSKVFLKT
jgi:predicted RNA-binding protein